MNKTLSNFDWGVVAKGLISTTRGRQPIAETAVGLGNHSFLHHTKQQAKGEYANVQRRKKRVQCVRDCRHLRAPTHVFSSHMHTLICRLFHIGTDTNQRKFNCGWWPFIVASNFLLFYFKTMNLWTTLATLCLLSAFERWLTATLSTHFKGRGTAPQARRRMQSHRSGITRLVRFSSNWSLWQQVVWPVQWETSKTKCKHMTYIFNSLLT